MNGAAGLRREIRGSGKMPTETRHKGNTEGAQECHLLDLSNLLWGSEDTCSLKKDGEKLPEAGGWVVCPQRHT